MGDATSLGNVFLQIFKVNPINEGIGKVSKEPYRMQDCECAILDGAGEIQEVGVLLLSKEQVGNTVPGVYVGSFALRAAKGKEGGRRIQAQLTGLRAMKKTAAGFVPVDAAPAKPGA